MLAEKKSTLQVKLNSLFDYSRFREDNAGIDIIRANKKFVSPYKLPNLSYVGIEVEVEQVFRREGIIPLASGVKVWNYTEDGSLRNHGAEFVSSPLRGDNIPFALSQLNKTLKTEKNCIGHEFTDRTSVHIHMDVRDLSLEEMANLVMTYIIVEPLMYNFCGGKRHQSIFCVPLNLSTMTGYLNEYFRYLEAENMECLSVFHIWPKYTGFNLRPVSAYGTVEFRHMVGTCDVDRLMQWISLILKLKSFAKSQEYFKLKERLLNLNTTSEYRLFIFDVFGDSFELVREDKLEQHMENMVIFLKDVFTNQQKTSFLSKEIVKQFNETPDKFKFTEHAKALQYIVDMEEPEVTISEDDLGVEVVIHRDNVGTVPEFFTNWTPTSVIRGTTFNEMNDTLRRARDNLNIEQTPTPRRR